MINIAGIIACQIACNTASQIAARNMRYEIERQNREREEAEKRKKEKV